MNKKYQNFTAGRAGSGRINLATGAMEFSHEDTKAVSSILPISISHIYTSENTAESPYGKGFKLNLQQKLTHRSDDDTKWKYIDANGEEYKFKERYYYKIEEIDKITGQLRIRKDFDLLKGKKSGDFRIKQDGSLVLLNKPNENDESTWTEVGGEVFAEIKTKSGLQLHTQLKGFNGGGKIETRHEELVKVEEEIKQLKLQSKQVAYEYEALKGELINNQFKQKKLDSSALKEVGFPSDSATVEQVQTAIKDETEKYNNLISKKNGTAQRMNILKIKYTNDFIPMITEIIPINESNFERDSYKDYSYSLVDKPDAFVYKNNIGEMADYFSLRYSDQTKSKDYTQTWQATTFFQTLFNEKCERHAQNIREWNWELEKFAKEYQDKNINNIKSNMLDIQKDILAIRANKENFNLKEGQDLVDALSELAKIELKTIDNKLEYKEYICEKLQEQLPVNYIVDKERIIFGFNTFGNLVALFDNNGNQTSIIYQADRISKIVDCSDKEIVFEYICNQLASITDFQDRKVKFEYKDETDSDLLTNVIYPNGDESKFIYKENQLAEIIAPNSIGISIQREGNKITLADVSYTIEKADNKEQEKRHQKNEIVLAFDSAGNETEARNAKTGASIKYYFDGDYNREEHKVDNEFKQIHTTFDSENYSLICVQDKFDAILTAADFNNEMKDDEIKSKLNLTKGEWVLTRFNEDHKTEYYSDKEFNGVIQRIYKEFDYENDNLIEERTVIQTQGQPDKIHTTKYEYNKQNKIIRISALPSGIITETSYDEKGNVEKAKTYHKSNPASAFYNETEKENNTKNTALGYDFHTGELLSMTASANGEANANIFEYEKGMLKSLESGNTKFNYSYDKWGRKIAIDICDKDDEFKNYVRYYYEKDDKDNDIIRAEYASGEEYKTITDKYGKLLEVLYKRNEDDVYHAVTEYRYDSKDRLEKTLDYKTHKTTQNFYDDYGNVYKQAEGDIEILSTLNIDGNVEQAVYDIGGNKQVYNYEYDADGGLQNVILPSGDKESVKYDKLGRLSEIKSPVGKKEIFYYQNGDHATNLVTSVYDNGKRTKYIYDANGNITEILENGKTTAQYEYDGLNRLIKDGNYCYEYDANGNILCKTKQYKKETKLIANYTYDGDRLMQFKDKKFEYDALGNPTHYKTNSKIPNMEWEFRNLVKYGCVKFKYNAAGLRIEKTKGNTETKYFWAGDKLIAEKRTKTTIDYDPAIDNDLLILTDTNYIEYMYGVDGITGFTLKHNNEDKKTYYYQKNIQGDVTHIYKESHCEEQSDEAIPTKKYTLVAEYVYDAWGNHEVICYDEQGKVVAAPTAAHIGNINPIRYRGYYYDTETKLHYLKSRYYDAEVGRFINMDTIEILNDTKNSINGLNLYMYCGDNPVMNIDETGYGFWSWLKKTVNTVGKIFSAVGNFVANNWDIILGVGLVVGSVALGILTFGGTAVVGAMIAGGIFGGFAGGVSAAINGGNIGWGILSGMLTGVIGSMSGGFAPLTAGLAAAGMSMISDRINGQKAGWDTLLRAASAGFTAAIFAGLGDELTGQMTQGIATTMLDKIVANTVSAVVFSMHNFVTDLIINKYVNWKRILGL